jgi:hypothetical protein
MRTGNSRTDTVRPSRDGHEFHEAWAARQALGLLMPSEDLVGIAIEGFDSTENPKLSSKSIEIADVVMYYGSVPTFEDSRSVVVVQLKYSISSADRPFRAADAHKTIIKFADAFRDHKQVHPPDLVEQKLSFELITNRPIYDALARAIGGLANGARLMGATRKQATQFAAACGFKGKELADFASKIRIVGDVGNLRENKIGLARQIADWSAARDGMARIGLANMKQMLRDKAGSAGLRNNIVSRTDVLDALELQGPDDLFPCSSSFPEVGKIVEREQLEDLTSRIPHLTKPLLIHADGGCGKTVFLQSLAKTVGVNHKTVLFDCFGGGSYRSPEDGRHLPKRGLLHIVNKLAVEGLCDALLPNSGEPDDFLKAFRKRLAQAVETLRRVDPDAQIVLFLDAVDNAAEHANDSGEPAFPGMLLASHFYHGAIPGLQLVLACRSYRRDTSRGDLPPDSCEEFELKPFTFDETKRYLTDRLPNVTDTEMRVAFARSRGNPRILEHLADGDRGLLEPTEIGNVVELDKLIEERIASALNEAIRRGFKSSERDAFLAGLAVLPPPVPLDEYADAHALDLSAANSFASDLAKLLEQTRHGITFRDEPTETYVRENYAADDATLQQLAKNLWQRQEISVYAAISLPGLLSRLKDSQGLFSLAFDDRFPASISSKVGRQKIRYERLKAAVRHAASEEKFDQLVHLLVELSALAAVNERGTKYLLDNPDLVIASNDIEAARRLFEARTSWPGARFARIAIAQILAGDLSDALRYLLQADEWIAHFHRQKDEYRYEKHGPEDVDRASIAFGLFAQGRTKEASDYLDSWQEDYGFKLLRLVFRYLRQAQQAGAIQDDVIEGLVGEASSEPFMLVGTLCFWPMDQCQQRAHLQLLAESGPTNPKVRAEFRSHQSRPQVYDGMCKSAAIALSLGMSAEAGSIIDSVQSPVLGLFGITDRTAEKQVVQFLVAVAIRAAVEGRSVEPGELLPTELKAVGEEIEKGLDVGAFIKSLKDKIENYPVQSSESSEKTRLNGENKRQAINLVDYRLRPLLQIVQAFARMLGDRSGTADDSFRDMTRLWSEFRTLQEGYADLRQVNWFFDEIGRRILRFVLWSRPDLGASAVREFVSRLYGNAPVSTLISVIDLISNRPELHEEAGKLAVHARGLIEQYDSVDERSSDFAKLSRAILFVSSDEATAYFRIGLDQMDAIGSGDYRLTTEILNFASKLRAEELDEPDVQTLSNICELNLYDQDKFPWLDFAQGMSRAAGLRIFGKLARWDDREKAEFGFSLLPVLTSLLDADKIEPDIALGILRLSKSVELHVSGTAEMASVIDKKSSGDSKRLITVLLRQFLQNHPGVHMWRALPILQEIAQTQLGTESEVERYLSVAVPRLRDLQTQTNELRNGSSRHENEDDLAKSTRLEMIAKDVDSKDPTSVSEALEIVNDRNINYDDWEPLFGLIRGKIEYKERPDYLRTIASISTISLYRKVEELQRCKAEWAASSSALDPIFRKLGESLIRAHSMELLFEDSFSDRSLRDIAAISSTPEPVLAIQLAGIYAGRDVHVAAAVWMNLAAIICGRSTPGQGQKALKRLLNSEAAKFVSIVEDGEWREEFHLEASQTEIAAGLVWRSLGAPAAEQRWRAAHSLRTFASFGRWEVVESVLARFATTNGGAFQAPELPFYFLHARLWLLVAIARIAIDHPGKIAEHAEFLNSVAFDQTMPHVLFRHFSAQALLACERGGGIKLGHEQLELLKNINRSSFSPKETDPTYSDYYSGRPASIPKPENPFRLEYEFDKTDVAAVARVFDRSHWEMADAVSDWVRKFDPTVSDMYESGGRSKPSYRPGFPSEAYHMYGYNLGWHALFCVAGDGIAKYPVLHSRYRDEQDPLAEWIARNTLTRGDGLWLSDGTDWPPVDSLCNLLEAGSAITGDKRKLLELLRIDETIGNEVIISGTWHSADGIAINISSALVDSTKASQAARKLSREDPFQVWLPAFEQYDGGDEYSHHGKDFHIPWIVSPHVEPRLDGLDLLASRRATARERLADRVNALLSLSTSEPFQRDWVDPSGRTVVRSEAWRREPTNEDREATYGKRLVCLSEEIKPVLADMNSDLLILLLLRRYESGYSGNPSRYWHTTAVVQIKESLDFIFYKGRVNELHKSDY